MIRLTVPPTRPIVNRGIPHNAPSRPARRVWPASLRRILGGLILNSRSEQGVAALVQRVRAHARRTAG